MLNTFGKTVLSITGFAPIAVVYAAAAAIGEKWCWMIGLITFAGALVALCMILIQYAKCKMEEVPFKASKVETIDHENQTTIFFYLVPLITIGIENINWYVVILVLVVLIFVFMKGYSRNVNLLLYIFGWHFYKTVTTDGVSFVLITKRQIRNPTCELIVGELTEYVVLDLGPVKE